MKKIITLLLVTFFAVTFSKATIHYVISGQTAALFFHDTIFLDVDANGTNDFRMWEYMQGNTVIHAFMGINNSQVTVDLNGFLDSIATGSTIGPSMPWSTSGNSGIAGSKDQFNQFSGPLCGKTFYVGLKIKSGANTYYGWAKLSSDAPPPNVSSDFDIILWEYAWSDGEPITAGQTTGLSTGLYEVSTNSLNVYPNPSTGSMTLSLDASSLGNAKIIVTNILGETVYAAQQEVAAGNVSKEIRLENAASGVYFVQVSTGAGVFSKKIVISR